MAKKKEFLSTLDVQVRRILYEKRRKKIQAVLKSYYDAMHPPDFRSHFVPFGQQCRLSSQQTPYGEKKVIQIINRINNLHREKHSKHIDHHLIQKFCSKFDQIDKQHPMIHNNYKFHFRLKSFHSIDKINDLHHKYIYMDNMMNHLNHSKHP